MSTHLVLAVVFVAWTSTIPNSIGIVIISSSPENENLFAIFSNNPRNKLPIWNRKIELLRPCMTKHILDPSEEMTVNNTCFKGFAAR